MMRATGRIALLVAIAAAGCSDGDDAPTAGPTTTVTPGTTVMAPEGYPIADVSSRELARLELVSPDWLVADETGVWVKRDNGFVDRIDPDTNEVSHTVDVRSDEEAAGAKCAGLGVGFGSVWTCSAGDVVRIDPERAEITATLAVGKIPTQGRLATGFDRVWVLTGDGSTLIGIDPETETTVATVELGMRGTDLGTGEAGLWVVSALDDQVLRLDPESGEVRLRLTDIASPTSVSVTDEVWVGASRTTNRLDPGTGEVLASSDFGSGTSGTVLRAEEGVWVRSADRFLVRMDDDATPVEGLASADTPSGGDVLEAFGSLWTTAYDDGALFRISLDP